MNFLKAVGFAVPAVVAASASAQSLPLVGLDLRSFGNDERLTYFGISASETFQNQFKLQLGGVFSSFDTFSGGSIRIRHGGTDIELLGTYMPPKIPGEISIGVAFPHTPDRGVVPALTYRAAYRIVDAKEASLSIESFGVADPSPLVVGGLGGTYRCGPTKFKAFLGAPFDGLNSVSVSSGNRIRVGLFSLGADWTCSNNTFTLAVTNQLGWTTGMMATPALGGNAGVEASWKVTF